MADNIIPFPGVTSLDLAPNQILDNAPRDLESAVIVGYDADGELYFASSVSAGPEVLWLLEKAKKALLEVGDDE